MTRTSEKLSVLERLSLLNILPEEGSYLDMKILRKFRESLSFTEEEQKLLKFRSTGDGKTKWSDENDPNKVIHFGQRMETIIRESLVALETSQKLRDEHLSVYEKFVGVDDDSDE